MTSLSRLGGKMGLGWVQGKQET